MARRKTTPAQAIVTPVVTVGVMPKPTRAERLKAARGYLTRKRSKLLFAGLLAGIVALSQVIVVAHAPSGVYASAAAVLALGLVGLRSAKRLPVAIAASVIPLIGLVGFSTGVSDAFDRAILTSIVLLLVSAIYIRQLPARKPARRLRLDAAGYVLQTPVYVGIGAALASIAFWFVPGAAVFSGVSASVAIPGLVLFGFAEELFMRGLVQRQAARALSPGIAAGLAIVLSVAVSVPFGDMAVSLYAALAGTVLAWVYMVRQNVVLTMIANSSARVLLYALMLFFV